MPQLSKTVLIAALLLALVSTDSSCSAQTVQLPVIQGFGVNSTVSVPDGGVIRLGGVNRSRTGSISRGVPGLSNLPGLNRGFRNRAIGRETGSSQATVKVDLIIMSELEAQVMAEAERRQAIRQRNNPNGSRSVQRKADFISRNIGR